MEIEKYSTLIIAFIMGIAGIGAGTTLNQSEIDTIYDQMEDVYVCDSTGIPAYCPGTPTHPEPLSGTSVSCYYTNDEPRDTYSRCSKGIYVPVVEYSEQNGVDIFSLIYEALNLEQSQEQKQKTPSTSKKELCYTNPRICYEIVE